MIRLAIPALALFLLVPLSAQAAPDRGAAPPAPAPAEAVSVTFQLNDATVKDKALPGVRVGVRRVDEATYLATGQTGADGKVTLSLQPGGYLVTYLREGYIPLRDSAAEVTRHGQVITTTLSMMLEAAGHAGQRRIQIVLNWGNERSQVKDADAHLMRLDLDPLLHVFWNRKIHPSAKVNVELDVDDTDWGGPETITLIDPPPGRYTYWVHNYSGEPQWESTYGSEPGELGESAVKVRVLFGDRVAGEFAAPPEAKNLDWRPFAALEVDPMLEPKIVPFSDKEKTAGAAHADVNVPADAERPLDDIASEPVVYIDPAPYIIPAVMVLMFLAVVVILRKVTKKK